MGSVNRSSCSSEGGGFILTWSWDEDGVAESLVICNITWSSWSLRLKGRSKEEKKVLVMRFFFFVKKRDPKKC